VSDGSSVHAHRRAAPRTLGAVVLTVSDTRTLEDDTGGALLAELVAGVGHRVVERRIVTDDVEEIRRAVCAALAREGVHAVLLTGGTGIAPRDLAYDILSRLYTRPIPGFGELFRALSYAEIGPAAMLSRASAGLAGERLVFSIPGSRGAVRLALDKLILPELAHLVGELQRTRPPGGAR
jgi:molybdenum cofactor biosynthesis protein B